MHYETKNFTLELASPAFLGNAQQAAQWRTAPIKALLRQWWRVDWMQKGNYPVSIRGMREQEARLFGHAWLKKRSDEKIPDGDSLKSQLQLRLYPVGKARPETFWLTGSSKMSDNYKNSYAGFGLTDRKALRAVMPGNPPEARRELRLAAPSGDWASLHNALRLVSTFGTLGSGSRRGWGSVHIAQVETLSLDEMVSYARALDDCLKRDWAAALAKDTKGLCLWASTKTFKGWEDAMSSVALLRQNLRQSLPARERTVLGMPVSKPVPIRERFAGPLRWKFFLTGKEVSFRVFAMPHAFPETIGQNTDADTLRRTWYDIIAYLDSHPALSRQSAKKGAAK